MQVYKLRMHNHNTTLPTTSMTPQLAGPVPHMRRATNGSPQERSTHVRAQSFDLRRSNHRDAGCLHTCFPWQIHEPFNLGTPDS